MIRLEDALADIRQRYGIRRSPMPNPDYTYMLHVFTEIGNAMLDWKGVQYDAESMKPQIKSLLLWAAADSRCDGSLVRGYLLKGATGKGKTFLLQIFREWLRLFSVTYIPAGERTPKRIDLTIVNARKIASEYAERGTEVISQYADIPVLAIDDIGAESREQSSYGNKVNVINDILDRRQERGLITFGTTNYNELTPEAGYDDRMKRRINALFNIVSIKHGNKY